MEILRQVDNYSLVKTGGGWNENASLIYYIDNGVDVSQYFDEVVAERLLSLSDKIFVKHCRDYVD